MDFEVDRVTPLCVVDRKGLLHDASPKSFLISSGLIDFRPGVGSLQLCLTKESQASPNKLKLAYIYFFGQSEFVGDRTENVYITGSEKAFDQQFQAFVGTLGFADRQARDIAYFFQCLSPQSVFAIAMENASKTPLSHTEREEIAINPSSSKPLARDMELLGIIHIL